MYQEIEQNLLEGRDSSIGHLFSNAFQIFAHHSMTSCMLCDVTPYTKSRYFFQIFRLSRATFEGLAGYYWPTVHRGEGTTELENINNIVRANSEKFGFKFPVLLETSCFEAPCHPAPSRPRHRTCPLPVIGQF